MTDARRDFSDHEYVEAVIDLEPASTPEVAEHVGCTRENARLRLIELYENREIARKTIGKSYVWYTE